MVALAGMGNIGACLVLQAEKFVLVGLALLSLVSDGKIGDGCTGSWCTLGLLELGYYYVAAWVGISIFSLLLWSALCRH